eukprot:CAMPEP_0172758170 /NCGR_PEP_ID=MMETSP1074-20121228/165224_1 /TAXON_ID=2916 /ORGANISM="Ceratium fusus, Strain PA161109" /LENGTH=41 /DNA_ID= /DNA_START= /DNA_END= /DNA_ORIENTATION=
MSNESIGQFLKNVSRKVCESSATVNQGHAEVYAPLHDGFAS